MLEYAKDVIGAKAREEIGKANIYMMRFVKRFKYDYNSSPRNWKSSEEIPKTAESALYTLLVGLATIRLEEDDVDGYIDNMLSSALLKRDQKALKDLDSPTWEMVPSSRTLITPIQCKKLWEEFMVEVENTVNEALEAKLKEEIQEHVRHLLCEETDPTWSKIREYLTRKTELTLSSLDNALSKFSNEEVRREKIEKMQKHAKDVVKNKARQESFNAKNHMIIRFGKLFKYECDSRRDWRGDPLKVLTGLAAIRLEESDTDNVEDALFSTLSHSKGSNTSNVLDSPNWKEIPYSRILITPIQCKLLWKDYLVEAKEIVNQARKDIELKKNADTVKKIFSQIGGTVTTIFSAVWGSRRSRGTHKIERSNI
ncbi:hypothetical protein L6164_003045 [Bauhinia variegata]|uniref:Uncharacterized protein n=1 Tax=Bauhinia variegata TaxID=167791 RepID=A0ACB9Q294_BAUVA|nr:hypothetical protein L6164_003045 [Bauhinia variegata]